MGLGVFYRIIVATILAASLGMSAGCSNSALIQSTQTTSTTDVGGFNISTNITSLTAGNEVQVTVQILDANQNLLPAYSGTVKLTSTDPYFAVGGVAGAYSYTFVPGIDQGAHTFTATLASSGTQTISVTAAGDIRYYTVTTDGITVSSNTTIDPEHSILTIFPTPIPTPSATSTSILINQTAGLMLTAEDSYGNAITTGGAIINFSLSTGTGLSTGTFSSITDNSNGTYTATFHPTGAGTAAKITASSGGNNFGNTASISVYSGPTNVVFGNSSSPTACSYPVINTGTSGITLFSSSEVNSTSTLSISCTYQTIGLNAADPNFATAGTPCASLPTLTYSSGVLISTTAGTPTASQTPSVTWIPTSTQRGTYLFTMTTQDTFGVSLSTTSQSVLTVHDLNLTTQANPTGNVINMSLTNTAGTSITSGQLISNSGSYGYSGTAGVGTSMSYNATSGISFDGTSYITAGSNASDFNLLPITVSVMVNFTNSDNALRGIVTNSISGANTGWLIFSQGGSIYAWYNRDASDSISLSPTVSLSDGNWHTVTAVVSSTAGNLYVDGTLSSTTNWYGRAGATLSTSTLSIGTYEGWDPFIGSISNVLIYNRALSAQEVQLNAVALSSYVGGFDVLFSSDYTQPFLSGPTSSGSTWNNLVPNGPAAIGGSVGWDGNGAVGNPYGIIFSGAAGSSLTAGGLISTAGTQMGIQTWVQPSSPGTTSVITSNAGSHSGGMTLSQSAQDTTEGGTTITYTDRAQLVAGAKYYTYRDLVLSDHPVTFWRLNETGSTNVAVDYSAYGNNGTYMGTEGTNYTLGDSGPFTAVNDSSAAVLLDGTAGYIIGSQTVNTAVATVEAWIYPTALPTVTGVGSYGRLLGFMNGELSGTTDKILLMDSSGKIYFYAFDTSGHYTSTPTSSVNLNQWNQVVGVADGTNIFTYLNGSLVGSAVCGSTQTNYTLPNIIVSGAVGGNVAFYGKPIRYADVAIYNYALSSTQIQNHFNAGTSLFGVPYPGNSVLADNPTGYWRLNEKTGTVLAVDYSGNGNTGAYFGNYTAGQPGALTASGDSSTSTHFDGSSAYVNLGVPASFDFGTSSFTTEAWAKWTNTTTERIIDNGMFSASNGFLMEVNSSGHTGLNCGIGGGGTAANAPYVVGTSSLNNGNWHHLVCVFNSTTKTLTVYVDGSVEPIALATGFCGSVSNNVLNTSSCGSLNANHSVNTEIGTYDATSSYFSGNIAEVAIYNYPLSQAQITNHYNSGKGPGWWKCESLSQLSSVNWSFLSGLFDGTTLSLFFNGQLECSVQPGTTLAGASAGTAIASSTAASNLWTGSMAIANFFSSIKSSVPAFLSSSAFYFFRNTANRFRTQTIENIVDDDSLVLNLDPANANQGVVPYSATGCTASMLSWFDLSGSANNGTLTAFSSPCASDGWQGIGTTAAPYNLTFNGSTDYVVLPSTLTLNATGTSVAAWYKTSATASDMKLFSLSAAEPPLGVYLNNARSCFGSRVCFVGSTNNAANGNWHYMAATVDSEGNGILYLDGTSVATKSALTITTTGNPTIGAESGGSEFYFNGSIGPVQIYSRALSADEVKQNCLAQQGRFGITTCAAP